MSKSHITIDKRWHRPEPALIDPFRDAPSGNVSDAAGRIAAVPTEIKAITGANRFCGTALTVENGRVGNLGVWAALEHSRFCLQRRGCGDCNGWHDPRPRSAQ